MPGRVRDLMINKIRHTSGGRNAVSHIFELWVGLAGVVSGIVFFYSPASIDRNALALALGYHAAATWSTCYFFSGIGVMWGLLRPAPRFEVMALWLLGTATIVQGITILSIFGLRGTATAVTLAALTVASWLRAMLVQSDVLQYAREYDASSS